MPVSDQTPNVILIDSSENLMEVSGGVAVSTGTKGILFAGIQSNGSASFMSVDASGSLRITGSISTLPGGTQTVTGSITVPNTVTITGSVGVTNHPVTQSVTGSIGISGIPTITGSISVLNTVTVTGSVTTTVANPTLAGTGALAPTTGSLIGGKDTSGNFQPFAVTTSGFQFISGNVSASIVGTPTVTGSVTVPNTVTVTGSVGVANFPATQSVTGTIGISGIPTVTGSITVPNTVNITGSVGISGTPTVTGSVSVLNTVNVTFSDPAEGVTGSAPPSRAIFIGGYDAGSVVMRALSVDATGKLNVNATAAGSPNVAGTGSTAPSSASLGGAVDGSGILRPLLSDNSGRQIVQVFNTASITGSVALSQTATVTGSITVPNTVTVTGSLTVPNTVTITGSVGITNFPVTQSVTGSVGISGIATVTGSVTIPNLVTITGSVGIVDSTFDTTPGGSVPSRIAIVGGVSGSTALSVRVNNSGSMVVNDQEEKTFVVRTTSTAIGNNKSMLSLLNASATSYIQLKEVYIINVQTSAVTGIAAIFELFRFTGHSAGTLLTPQPYDTADSLDVGVTARTGATITGEITPSLARWLWASDEWGVGALDTESNDHALQNLFPSWLAQRAPNTKAILLRPGQGIHIKHTVNSTAGTFDIVFVFTQF